METVEKPPIMLITDLISGNIKAMKEVITSTIAVTIKFLYIYICLWKPWIRNFRFR